ncbi:hypothetical protein P7F60_06350 [Rhizobium sp. YJ-22]|uniref:hypothetical protein n=1 Tax=Rhizobium sp. YJ-22 TaxID=3037556 RepID=UPI002412520E|nr:hypothetical protein [Rhizobium sp. YJ-22]MDG3575997.1 hypothetical protein [Rhizobium sp. YJ-22]
MRFVKATRHGPFEDTSRKRAALARKQRMERERLPLFAEVIAEQQPDADTVMAKRAVQWDQWQQEHRDQRAQLWRRARQRLFGYGNNIRLTLRRLWNTCPYPGTPVYLLDLLHSYDVGRLDPENPPWIYRGPGWQGFDITPILERAKARQSAERTRAV